MAPFSTPAQEDTNVIPASGGDYLFRLLVSDGRYTSFAEVSLSAASAGNSYTLWTVSEGLVGEDASPSADRMAMDSPTFSNSLSTVIQNPLHPRLHPP